jgi:hypothetical protein
MRMRFGTFFLTAAVSLSLTPAAFADTATEDLLLARDACGSTDTLPAAPRLAFSPGASTGGCGSLAAIGGGSPTEYPATEGVPVTLDESRPIYVAISTSSYLGVAVGGVGPETVEIELTGKNAVTKKTVELGSGTVTRTADEMLTTAEALTEFNLPITGKGGPYSALNLTLTVGGSQFSGFVNHDGSSYVSLPIFDADVPVEEEA